MIFREATAEDILQIQVVRNSVKENMLSDPALVPDSDVYDYISRRGKGWVCEIESRITGFAIADIEDNNIWALFIDPEYEARGIGKQLHRIMLDWYFEQTENTLWLSTGFNTRADEFYRRQGWKEAGLYSTKETKFEMTFEDWKHISKKYFIYFR